MNVDPEQIVRDVRGDAYYYTQGFPQGGGGWLKTPRDLLRDGTLDPASKLIYMLIVDECQRTQQPTVVYSYGRIRNETGIVSHHTIRRKLALLEDEGFLEVTGDEGRASANTERFYTPLPFAEAVYTVRVTEGYAKRAERLARERQKVPIDQVPSLTGTGVASRAAEAGTAAHNGERGREDAPILPPKEEDTSDLSKTSDLSENVTSAAEPSPGVREIDIDELRDFLQDEDAVQEYIRLFGN